MKRMEHQDRANCRPLYDAGCSQKHDHTNDCDQSFHATLEVYVIHRVENFAAQCCAEHGQWDGREDEPPAWQRSQPSGLNNWNAPEGDFDHMGECLCDSLGCDDLMSGQGRVDEKQVNQWPSDPGRGVQRLNGEARDFGLPLLRDVEIKQGFGHPDQHSGEAQHNVDHLSVGAPRECEQDTDAQYGADSVAPENRPQNMLSPEKGAITVRYDLNGAVQDHRCGNGQEGRQDAHQHHAARHAEDAGQESRGQDGYENDRGGQNIHAACFMEQFANACQIRRCDSTDFAADLSAIPQMICTPSPVWLS